MCRCKSCQGVAGEVATVGRTFGARAATAPPRGRGTAGHAVLATRGTGAGTTSTTCIARASTPARGRSPPSPVLTPVGGRTTPASSGKSPTPPTRVSSAAATTPSTGTVGGEGRGSRGRTASRTTLGRPVAGPRTAGRAAPTTRLVALAIVIVSRTRGRSLATLLVATSRLAPTVAVGRTRATSPRKGTGVAGATLAGLA